MRKIDLWKVLQNMIKCLWLPILLAAIGVLIALSLIQPVPAQWIFNAIYLIDLQQPDERSTDFNTYMFEIQLAGTVSQVLTADLKADGIKDFTLTSSNRRIYVSGNNQDKEYLQLVVDRVEEDMRKCMQAEIGISTALKTEQYTFSQQESSNSGQKKTALLGGLVGLCIGLAVLMLMEYAKSPVAWSDSNKQEVQS